MDSILFCLFPLTLKKCLCVDGESVQRWHQCSLSVWPPLSLYLCSFSSSTFYCGHLQKITTLTVTVTNLWSVCFKSHLYQLLSLPQAAFGCNTHSKVNLLGTRSIFMCSLFALIWTHLQKCVNLFLTGNVCITQFGSEQNCSGFLKQMLLLSKLSSLFNNPLNVL